jgi:hypothetical protein
MAGMIASALGSLLPIRAAPLPRRKAYPRRLTDGMPQSGLAQIAGVEDGWLGATARRKDAKAK